MNHLDQDEELLKIIKHANAFMKEIQKFKSDTGIKVEAINLFAFNNSMSIMVDKIPAKYIEHKKTVAGNVHCYTKVGNAELFCVNMGGKDGETV